MLSSLNLLLKNVTMSDQLLIFSFLLIIHWFADFKFQSHRVAVTKSRDNLALVEHVAFYIGTFIYFFAMVWILLYLGGVNPQRAVLFQSYTALASFLVANFILHFCTDYVTSRMSSFRWKEQRWHDFFEVIGCDQLIHQMSLAVTMFYFFFRG